MLWGNRSVYNRHGCYFRTKAELYSCNISPLIPLTSLSLPASRQRWISTEERGWHQNALGLESGHLRNCLKKKEISLACIEETLRDKIQFLSVNSKHFSKLSTLQNTLVQCGNIWLTKQRGISRALKGSFTWVAAALASPLRECEVWQQNLYNGVYL